MINIQHENGRHFDLENFYLKQLVDNLPEFLFWKDKNSVFLGCNKNFASMAGLATTKEIIGKTDYDLPWSKEESDAYRADDLEVIHSGQGKYNIEETQTTKTGEQIILLTNKIPLYDQYGNITGVLGIYIDITELKNSQLRLQEEKLRAEAANRAKTEFLANMSHDVKTPLLTIALLANMLLENATNEVDRQNIQLLLSCQKQLKTFFKNCLDNANFELDSLQLSEEKFSIHEMLKELSDLFMPQAKEKALSLDITLGEETPQALIGHPAILFRIILNLIGNAFKFTEKGGISIRVEALQQKDDQVDLSIAVQDTGIGIPEDKQVLIFERLSRLAPAFSNRIEGSGIGLYIVDQYVKRMEGTIHVNSRLGEGSTFTVTIPFKVVSDCSLVPPTAKPVEETQGLETSIPRPQTPPLITTSATLSPSLTTLPAHPLARVLLVEDTEMIQFVTQSLLNTAGFAVEIANSGEEAVAMFAPGKYDLIYMDIGLPGMSGYDAARAIREKESAQQANVSIPIIALTGHGAIDIQNFCGQAGMQGVLSKPLSREQAEKIWHRYGQHERIDIPGFVALEPTQAAASPSEILDIPATIQLIGSQEVADKLIAELIRALETEFLPTIKTLMEQQDHDRLRFELHKILGSLAYVKAPLLQQTLLDLQRVIHSGTELSSSAYPMIEQAVRKVINSPYEVLKQKISG